MRCHQLKRAIDAILSLMLKEIRGKLFAPNVHKDAIYIQSLFSASDRALIGSQGGSVSAHAAAIATVQAGLRSSLYSIIHSMLYTHVSVVN